MIVAYILDKSLQEERLNGQLGATAFDRFLREICPSEWYTTVIGDERFNFLYRSGKFDKYIEPAFEERHGRVFAIRKWIRNNPQTFLGILEWELL
jgi:hypothetical protein